MGVDSYRIVATLYADPFFTSVSGSTGELRMDTQGRIHRDLPFAQYRSGIVETLDALPLAEPLENDPLPNVQPVFENEREPIESGFPERRFEPPPGAGD